MNEVFFEDEPVHIKYDTSPLPPRCRVQLLINGKEAIVNELTSMAVEVPGLIVGGHNILINILDEEGNAHQKMKMRIVEIRERDRYGDGGGGDDDDDGDGGIDDDDDDD
eukprot:762521-Hanusia_phi.AAC.23